LNVKKEHLKRNLVNNFEEKYDYIISKDNIKRKIEGSE